MDEVWLWKRICSKTGEFNDELYRQMMQIELPKSSQEVTYVIRLIKKYVTHPVYLVLDDYQECTSSAMNRLLEAYSTGRYHVPYNHAVKNIS